MIFVTEKNPESQMHFNSHEIVCIAANFITLLYYIDDLLHAAGDLGRDISAYPLFFLFFFLNLCLDKQVF